MDVHVLGRGARIPESPRHTEGMNPPALPAHWPNKSMELVFQILYAGQGHETWPLTGTRYVPSVKQQQHLLKEEGRPGHLSEIVQGPLVFHKMQSCISNITFESCGFDRGVEFLKDFGVYRIKILDKKSTKSREEKGNELLPSSYNGCRIV